MSKRKTKPKFKVVYKYVPSPNSQEKVNYAMNMLFDEIEKILEEEKPMR